MKVRTPANIYLRRAQLILLLAAIVPTILTTPVGIILLASGGSSALTVVAGVLVLAFCASAIAGYVLGSMFLRRGASLVDTQHQFLSSVSHELRTPMTSIRMFLEALLDDRLTDRAERERCLKTLQKEMVRLDDLVGRLIELSRIEMGRRPYERVPIDAQEIVDAAMAAFDAVRLDADADADADVTVHLEQPDLRVLGDRAELVQVLANLLSNAWKHGGDPKQIRLTVRSSNDRHVVFSVEDNGPGIPVPEREKVFRMFERGDAAVRSGIHGSGIGLAIVRAIVEKHRGRIEFESGLQGGSTFHVFLRRAPRSSSRAG